ncbi:MAG: hypothetical protein ABIT05_13750 [Chitinophagaceae bacterium]
MKWLICSLFFIVACSQKQKTNPAVGEWEYTRMEAFDGTPMNLEDSLIADLHQRQTGLHFSFSAKNVFKVTQHNEKLAEQPYELVDSNKALVLKNTGRADDKFDLVELSDSLMKINLFHSDKAYMVFEKKK